ncbi:unnamed protein product [Ectocarpus sp. CCAP 1310/34]|nr:unnamed protein product [Ectocarpus sp. CCAP 1310/34]
MFPQTPVLSAPLCSAPQRPEA